ncbi:glycosyl hydrolase [Herbiconiux sp. 11R-BC]|uniref:glycosyl hydrolase n=1 Tax=Herbiconiux sp. 11R-BC TaxID=3111637 RepID=UPI003C0AE3FE
MVLAALIAAALLTLAGATAVSAGVDQSNTLTSWSQFATGGTDVTVTADASIHHSGSTAAKIVSTTPQANNAYGGIVQSIPVQPSTAYVFAVWVRGAAVASSSTAQVVLSPDWATRRSFPSGTYDWTQVTWTYTTTSSQSTLDYRFLLQNVGTVWLDDLSITAPGSTTNLLSNPGFEAFSTSPPPSTPTLGITTPSLVFTAPSRSIALTSNRSAIAWTATDASGAAAGSGTLAVSGGTATLNLSSFAEGYYGLQLTTNGSTPLTRTTSFAVLPPQDDSAQGSDSRFGLSYSAAFLTADQMSTIDQLGPAYVRFDVSWARVEPTQGQYTMPQFFRDKFDAIVAAGMRPLIILDYRNPFYDGGHTPSTPAGIAGFANYGRYVAGQFGTAADYEVYNEFDSTGFNDGACGLTADCYLEILKAVSEAVHDQVPGAKVAGPALAGIDLDWLKRFFEIGGLQYLDAVSVHKYARNLAPEGVTAPLLTQLQALIKQYSDGQDAPIWLTETGYNTSSAGVTEQQQADYLARDMVLNLQTGLDREFWYGFVDACVSSSDKECRYGMLRNMNEGLTVAAPKPVFVTYATLTRQLAHFAPRGMETLAEGAYSGVFENPAGVTKRVLWSTTPVTVDIAADGPVTITDQWGATTTVTPVGGVLPLTLGEKAVYLAGPVTAVTSPGVDPGGETPGTPIPTSCVTSGDEYTAAFPAAAPAGETIDVAVSVDCSGIEHAVPTTVRFATPDGSRSILVPSVSGTVTTATLQIAAAAAAGPQSVVVQAQAGGSTVAEFSHTVSVVDNKVSLAIVPKDDIAGLGADVVVTNRSTNTTLTATAVSAELGTAALDTTVPTTVPPGQALSFPIDVAGLPEWSDLDESVTVVFADGITRSITGTTALAPAFAEGTPDAPSADLREDGRALSLAGDGNATPEDLSGSMWVADQGISVVVHAVVTDDVQTPSATAADIWTKDSVQFAFAAPGATAAQRFEIGAGLLTSGNTVVYGFAGVTGTIGTASATITRDDTAHTTTYAVTLPKSVIGLPEAASVVDYSFIVNDSDGTGRTGYLEWGSGIGATKDPSMYRPVILAG